MALRKLEQKMRKEMHSLQNSYDGQIAKINEFNPLPRCPQCGSQEEAPLLNCTECEEPICERCQRRCGVQKECTNHQSIYCRDCDQELKTCDDCGTDFCDDCRGYCEFCQGRYCCNCTTIVTVPDYVDTRRSDDYSCCQECKNTDVMYE